MTLSAPKKKHRLIWFVFGFALILLIGYLNFLTGWEFDFSLFYIIPIVIVTWLLGPLNGLAASISSAFAWAFVDAAMEHPYTHTFFPLWNTLIRLGFFVIITALLTALKRAHDRERLLARMDSLTGAVNARHFNEILRTEMGRSERHHRPFALAYIDLDNFKSVNDQFGHSEGDEALRTVYRMTRKFLRKSDVIARLGGDEFGILLPETDADSAPGVIDGLQHGLVREMNRHHWGITFSIGVLICYASPKSPDEIIKLADTLMYEVKNNKKDGVKFATYPTSPDDPTQQRQNPVNPERAS